MSWIPCSERLPEPGLLETSWGGILSAAVLGLFPDEADGVWQPGLNICICYCVRFDNGLIEWYTPIDYGGFDRCSSHGGKNPTHWMALPEAPKEEA